MKKHLSFKITLFDEPQIYRIIEIKENQKLSTLSKTILKSYNFNDDHSHFFTFIKREFKKKSRNINVWGNSPKYWDINAIKTAPDLYNDYLAKGDFSSETQIKKLELKKGDTGFYLFDFGEDWIFIIDVTEINECTNNIYPRVVKTVGDSPNQYEDYSP